MELSTFIANFANQFEETEANLITGETKFKELEEWSSLIALLLISMIDDEYNVKITGDDVRNVSSTQDLFDIVTSRI
jgi:acyl carrier protein